MHKMVAPWVPGDARGNDSRERAYYTVAALIAYQQRAARDADAAELADDTAPGNTAAGDMATGDTATGDVLAGRRAPSPEPRVHARVRRLYEPAA